jgi:hypothetical protein
MTQPEGRHGDGQQADQNGQAIPNRIAVHGSDNSQGKAQRKKDRRGRQGQLDGVDIPGPELIDHRLIGAEGTPKIQPYGLLQIHEILNRDRLVQPQLAPDILYGFCAGPRASPYLCRVARQYLHDHEDQRVDPYHHRDQAEELPDYVAQHILPQKRGLSVSIRIGDSGPRALSCPYCQSKSG